jgi:hypothetical protein
LFFLFNNLITSPDLIFPPNEFARVHVNEYSFSSYELGAFFSRQVHLSSWFREACLSHGVTVRGARHKLLFRKREIQRSELIAPKIFPLSPKFVLTP